MPAKEIDLGDLHTQMRITNRLLAAQLKPVTGQQEMVRLLSTTGASNAEIADVLDTTPATVATTIQRLRKRAKGKEPATAAADAASGVE